MEAPLRETKFGLVADVDGWFVVNARDSRWRDYAPLEAACDFEGKRPFRQLGFNISVLEPGHSLGIYHRESRVPSQEERDAMLTLASAAADALEKSKSPRQPAFAR